MVDNVIIITDKTQPKKKGSRQPEFKIWKLKANELILIVTTSEEINKPVNNGIGMIFKAK